MKYEIGNRIKKYRKEAGLTQDNLANMIGVSKNRISNWEQGINRPDADILAKLCQALKVSPSILLNIFISDDELNSHEKLLIKTYREKKDLQKAVDILLKIEKN